MRTSLPLSVNVRTITLFSMAMSILVALILGFIVARDFAKPLTAMTAIVESMSGGNYNQRVSIDRKDQIGSLSPRHLIRWRGAHTNAWKPLL